jgi:hypothetical protein
MNTVDFDPTINVADSSSTMKAGGLMQAGLIFHLFNTWQPYAVLWLFEQRTRLFPDIHQKSKHDIKQQELAAI